MEDAQEYEYVFQRKDNEEEDERKISLVVVGSILDGW